MRKPVMDHVEEAISCRSTLQTPKLAGVDLISDILEHPFINDKVFEDSWKCTVLAILVLSRSSLVMDSCLMSPSSAGGWIFGIGVMLKSFQIGGTTPVIKDTLNILVGGSESSYRVHMPTAETRNGIGIVSAGCLKGLLLKSARNF